MDRVGAIAVGTCLLALCGCADEEEPVTLQSEFNVVKEGHGPGRDLVVVTWKTRAGQPAGMVQVPVTGTGRVGPVSIDLPAVGGVPNANEWDTREWQWWKDCPFDQARMRPRLDSTTTGGADAGPGGVRAWTRFVCDGVETTQEWFFDDLDGADQAAYDCVITITNHHAEALEEYGQFFACYTAWNGKKGHYYWNADGTLVNYQHMGSRHLDYYVTAGDSMFARLGRVPHCPRGEGAVKATWKHPVSVSLPGPGGYRHVVMSEEARTSAIAQGMQGIAQDYLIYPPEGRLAPGGTFRTHVRHLVVRATDEQLPQLLERWWAEFTRDHERIRRLSRDVKAQPRGATAPGS